MNGPKHGSIQQGTLANPHLDPKIMQIDAELAIPSSLFHFGTLKTLAKVTLFLLAEGYIFPEF